MYITTETLVKLSNREWVDNAPQCEEAVQGGYARYARYALRRYRGKMQPVIELTEAGTEVLHKRQVERSTKIPEMG